MLLLQSEASRRVIVPESNNLTHESSVSDVKFAAGLCCLIFGLFLIPYKTDNGEPDQQAPFPRSMPALSSLRYILILVFCLNHSGGPLPDLFLTSYIFLVLSGFLLQFAEERRCSAGHFGWNKYQDFLFRRFSKLWPLFALMTVVGYTEGYDPNCEPISNLLVFPIWSPYVSTRGVSCYTGGWFIPTIMGCYAVFPIMSPGLRKLNFTLTCITVLSCGMLYTYAHVARITFPTSSLIFNLPLFFTGMALARLWALVSTSRFYSIFCQVACPLSVVALFTMPVGKGTCFLCRFTNVPKPPAVWGWICMSTFIVAFAGPRSDTTFNPLISVLSWGPLTKLGEDLAMPIYMAWYLTRRLVTKAFEDHDIPTSGLMFQAACFVLVHIIAWNIWNQCSGNTAPAKQKAETEQNKLLAASEPGKTTMPKAVETEKTKPATAV